ncbi:MAG: hypothetical protein AAB336_06455 [Acidobacteriota bacterium]
MLAKLIEAFVPIGLGGIIFIISAKLLHIDEVNKIYNALTRKLKR